MFRLDLFEFRARLQGIAIDNLLSVSVDARSVGFDHFAEWFSSADDEMIYPIDDDDYFHPALTSTAPDEDDTTVLVVWRHLQYTYTEDGAPCIIVPQMRTLFSNNWGVRKSFLRAHFDAATARRILADHETAAQELAAVLGIGPGSQTGRWWEVPFEGVPGVAVLPDSYGLSLKHVGSLLTLHRALRRGEMEALRRPRLDVPVTVTPELRWVEPWVRRAEAVFRATAPTA
ncbi:MAG TPA: hypothetical protein VNI78_12470 [Vicinamibacterales bacterium]|nr:hypothetical protein [Vicinamibacterales bacterium]